MLTLVVGTAALCVLAFAATVILPTANFAAAVTMTSTLVLYFLSGLFAREDKKPDTMRTIAGVFPVKPLFGCACRRLRPRHHRHRLLLEGYRGARSLGHGRA